MKMFLSFGLLVSLFSQTSLAQASLGQLEKQCTVSVSLPSENHDTDVSVLSFEIYKTQKGYSTLISVMGEGRRVYETAMSEHQIRPRLDLQTIQKQGGHLNLGEQMVAYALYYAADPELSKYMNTGLDINAISSVKVYLVGEVTNMGPAGIVEAKDQNGKVLGSFLSGMVVKGCE